MFKIQFDTFYKQRKDDARLNTDQLQYLIEISQNPSLNITSQKLHITPQALSMAIKKLEKELGFTLLNRSFKGISLTEDGEWLVQEGSKFLSSIEERKSHYAVKSKKAASGTLEIPINYFGINDTIFSTLVCTLYQQEPELNLVLKETKKEDILTSVQNDFVEFGIVFRTKLNGVYVDQIADDLIFEPIYSGKLVLIVNPSSELAKFNSVTLKKAVQYPICSYSPLLSPIMQDSLYNFITEHFKLSVSYNVESHYSIYKEKIQRGFANTLSVLFSTESYPSNYIEGCKIIHLRDDINIYCGIVKKNSAELSENARFFIQSLKDMLAHSQ